MPKNGEETREKIMEVTIALIEERQGNLADISMRDIAAKSDIGVGLINYHFTTKERLIRACVQRIIGGVIDGFAELHDSLDMSPEERLRFLAKGTVSFLVTNPGLSSVSILTDLTSSNPNDNSVQTFRAYFPVFREVLGDSVNEERLTAIVHMFIASLQVAFLRREVLKDTIGVDFLDSDERGKLVDRVIDCLLGLQK